MKRKLLIFCCVFILVTSCALIVSAKPPSKVDKSVPNTTERNATQSNESGPKASTPEPNAPSGFVDILQEYWFLVLIVLVLLLFVAIRSLTFSSKKEPQSASQMVPSIPQTRTLTISVLDEQKRPVVNATVRLKGMYSVSTQHTKQTGGDGRAVFNNIGSDIKQVEVTKMIDFEKQNYYIESNQERVEITLAKPKTILLKIIDEDEEPLCDIPVIIKDKQFSPQERVSKSDGIVKFIGLKQGEYQVSIEHQEYLPVKKLIPATDEGKRYSIKLTKQAGSLDVILDIQISGIKIVAKNIISNSEVFGESDSSGIVHFGKIPIGNYQISLQSDPLLKSDSHQCTIELNKKHTIKLMIDFNFKLSSENLSKMRQFKEIINISYQEVSSYDTCIQQYLKRIGEMPVELCENVSNKQLYFINSDLSSADFVQYTLDIAELLANGIAAILRDRGNIDLYVEAKEMPPVEQITLSEYSDSRLREIIQESAKYYTIHHADVKNQLSSIDQEITQKSSDLTVHPIADMWTLCKDLLIRCEAETDSKKQGVMLFLLEQMLVNLQEMFHNDDVIKRLKLRTF